MSIRSWLREDWSLLLGPVLVLAVLIALFTWAISTLPPTEEPPRCHCVCGAADHVDVQP